MSTTVHVAKMAKFSMYRIICIYRDASLRNSRNNTGRSHHFSGLGITGLGRRSSSALDEGTHLVTTSLDKVSASTTSMWIYDLLLIHNPRIL